MLPLDEHKQLLAEIKRKKPFWESARIETPQVLKDFLEYVKYSDATNDDWSERKKRIRNLINEYDQEERTATKQQETDISITITKEEKKKITLESKYTEELFTKKRDWVKAFSYYSVHNHDLAEMVYHVLLGLILRTNGSKILTINKKEVWPVVHLFAIQASATGKDQGVDFFLDIVKRYNRFVAELGEGVSIIRYYELSGTETMEALLDSFPVDNNNRPLLVNTHRDPDTGEYIEEDAEPVPGILSGHDLVIGRECSFLFRENRGVGRQTKSEVFLIAFEGRAVPKTLNSWRHDGRQFHTNTVFEGSFVGMSRPVRNMKSHLAYSGLQQRGLNLCRKITRRDREKMNNELAKLRNMSNSKWEDVNEQKNKIIKELYTIAQNVQQNGMPVIDEEQRSLISELVRKEIDDLQMQGFTELRNLEHRDISHTFTGRYNNHVDILAYHNAVSRKSKLVQLVDYQNALALLKKSYEFLKVWIEENVEKNFTQEAERVKRRVILSDIFTRKEMWRQEKLFVEINASMQVSRSRAQQLVQDWVDENVLKVVRKDNKKYILLN